MSTIQPGDLKEKLRRFLEVHCKTKVLTADNGQLLMYVKLAQKQNTKPKDKLIVYLLHRVDERLLSKKAPDEKDLVVCEFLINELCAFYKELG